MGDAEGLGFNKKWVYMLQCWQGAWNCLADVVHSGGVCLEDNTYKKLLH